MATIANLTVDLSLRAKNFTNDIRQAQKEMRATEKAFAPITRMGQNLQNVGRNLSMFVTLPLVAAGAASLKAAADAEESESKFRAVFKNAARDVAAWSESHAEATNRSALDLREYLSTLQDTFVPLGFARDQAAEMSKQLTQLGIDLASFNNRAEPEVIRNLTSAIVGNHEAVRSFGIVITQATLDIELLAMGIEGGARAASEQEKAMARLNIIMKATSDAQGDAARTAESFTNQMKGLLGNLKDAGVAIGNVLIPPLTKVVGIANSFLDTFNGLSPQMKTFIVGVSATAAALGPLALALGTVLTMFPTLMAALTAAKAGLLGLAVTGGPILLTVAALGILVTAAVAFRHEIGAALLQALSLASEGLGKFVGAISTVVYAITGNNELDASLQSAKRGLQAFASEAADNANAQLELTGKTEDLGAAIGEMAAGPMPTLATETGNVNREIEHQIMLLDNMQPKLKTWEDHLKFNREAFANVGAAAIAASVDVEKFGATIDRATLRQIAFRQSAEESFSAASDAYMASQERIAQDGGRAVLENIQAQQKAYDDLHSSIQKSFGQVFLANKNIIGNFLDFMKKTFQKILIEDILGKIVADFATGMVQRIQGAASQASNSIAKAFGGLSGLGGAGIVGLAAAGIGGLVSLFTGGGGPSSRQERLAQDINRMTAGGASTSVGGISFGPRTNLTGEDIARFGLRHGTDNVPRDMTTRIHQGEAVVTAASNSKFDRLIELLESQISGGGREIVLMVDREVLGRVTARGHYNLTRHEGMQVVGG